MQGRRGPAQGGEDLTEALISRQIPLVVPIAVGPSAHGSANLAGPIELGNTARDQRVNHVCYT